MKVSIGAEVTIDRSVEEVFRFVAVDHCVNHVRWDAAVSRIVSREDGPLRLGSHMEIVRRTLGREESRVFEVTEWVDPSRMAITTRSADFDLTLGSRFEVLAANRTRLTLSGDARISGPRTLLVPVMKFKFEAELRQNLVQMKQLLEGAASPRSLDAQSPA